MLNFRQKKELSQAKNELHDVDKEIQRLNNLRNSLTARIRALQDISNENGIQTYTVKKQDSVSTREFRTNTGTLRLDSNGQEKPVNYRQDFMEKTRDLHKERSVDSDDLEITKDSDHMSSREKYLQELANCHKG